MNLLKVLERYIFHKNLRKNLQKIKNASDSKSQLYFNLKKLNASEVGAPKFLVLRSNRAVQISLLQLRAAKLRSKTFLCT